MKLFRFWYSGYARKVQILIELIGRRCQVVEVPYGDRSELVAATGGYLQVPVLVDDDGKVVTDSRRICQHLLAAPDARRLLPAALQGPIWAYADWCDTQLEDVLFRLAAPIVRQQLGTATNRALFTYVKERKFGAGCVEDWAARKEELLERARELLGPTAMTLKLSPFVFGESPTLADAALYGQLYGVAIADPQLLFQIGGLFRSWMQNVETVAGRSRPGD